MTSASEPRTVAAAASAPGMVASSPSTAVSAPSTAAPGRRTAAPSKASLALEAAASVLCRASAPSKEAAPSRASAAATEEALAAALADTASARRAALLPMPSAAAMASLGLRRAREPACPAMRAPTSTTLLASPASTPGRHPLPAQPWNAARRPGHSIRAVSSSTSSRQRARGCPTAPLQRRPKCSRRLVC